MTVQDIKQRTVSVLRRHGVSKAAVFGSVARGEENKKSDVDILVDFSKRTSLMDMVKLQFALEEKLGRKVDLLTYGGIHYLLKDIILREQKIIYEKRLL